MKTKLAIFDLDGTLFDTNDVNYYAYKEALASCGYELDYEYFVAECNGRHYKEFLPVIMGNSESIEVVHDLKKTTYSKHLDKARVNTHLFDIIKSLKNDYYVSIVTTASRKNCMDILGWFKLDELFDLIISHEDVKKTKPNPEGFLKAMEYFNISKDSTIIFEDSNVGIEAAKNSGATVVRVEKF